MEPQMAQIIAECGAECVHFYLGEFTANWRSFILRVNVDVTQRWVQEEPTLQTCEVTCRGFARSAGHRARSKQPRANMRHRRIHRIVKWLGLLSCLAVAAAFAVSERWAIHWVSPTTRYGLGVGAGAFVVGWRPAGWLRGSERYPASPGWMVASLADGTQTVWWVRRSMLQVWSGIEVSLWIPFVILVVPTIFIWLRERKRIPPGSCRQCRYNLAGNSSGICPECGTEIPEKIWSAIAKQAKTPTPL